MNELTGSNLGRYQIVSLIARGGMAEVYKAYQPGLDRYVAIKVLHQHLADEPGFINRFEREAASVARLRHPNIVQVIDFDCQEGRYYMVMEYIEGASLKAELVERDERGEAYTSQEAAYVISGVASALDYAHGRGMVHRDIKPGNILFTGEGQVVLADFGIAHIVGTTLYTESAGALGTPAYLSPEQARGGMGDARSDIYSLGVVLYQMLVGRLPYEADTPLGLLQQHIEAKLPAPREVKPELAEDVEAVILKALAKQPEERYQSAGEMGEALFAALGLSPQQILRPVVVEEVEAAEEAAKPLPPCPYRGLFAFREEDAPYFFGRELFTERLVEAVEERTLVGVIGPSGSGKSSVVFAGLLPHLRQGAGLREAQGRAWAIAVCRPGTGPFYSLATALVPQLEGDTSDTARLVGTQEMALELSQEEISLGAVVQDILDKHPHYGHLLLVVDQFEELFTLGQDPEERRAFIDTLLDGIKDNASLTLVLTIRADFLGQAFSHRSFADALQDADLILGPMTRRELSEAVVNPAMKLGVAFEAGLVERILDDVGDEPGSLPLLEFALTQLWGEQKVGVLSHQAYEAIGCVDGALARYADQVYARLPQEEHERARRVFTQMVQPGEGMVDTRRLAQRQELGEVNWELVRRLADSRLVVTDLDVLSGMETVEVVHETLIQSWGQLQEWMREDRAFRTWQERLRAAMRGWEASERDEGALLRGGPLVEAEGWMDERQTELSDSELEYIQASIDMRQRKQAERERRRRWVIVGLTTGLIVALLLTIYAFNQRSLAQDSAAAALAEADARATQQSVAEREAAGRATQGALAEAEADARATAEAVALGEREEALRQASVGLAAQAELQLGSNNPERAVLLSIEALENYPYTWQAEHALGQAVVEHKLLLDLPHGAWVNSAYLSPDGMRIITAGDDGEIKLWDSHNGELLLTINAHEGTGAHARWSPSGDRILSSSFDAITRVFDGVTGEELLSLSDHGGFGSAWSPDGSRILSNYSFTQDSALVWDSQSGEVHIEMFGSVGLVKFAWWSPDGARIATSTGKILDAETGDELQTLTGFQDQISAQFQLQIAWSPDGSRIAGNLQGTGEGRIWDAETGRVMYTLTGHTAPFFPYWSPTGERLITIGFDGQAKVWNAETGDEIFTLLGVNPIGFGSDAWSPDGDRILTNGDPGWIKIWDANSGIELLNLRAHSLDVSFSKWFEDEKSIITASADGSARVWDVSQVHLPLGCQPDCPRSPVGGWYSIAAWSPSGDRIARGFVDGTVRVWDVNTGEELLTLQYETEAEHFLATGVGTIEWSPDGNQILTGSNDGIARIWDTSTGLELQQLSVNREAFDPELMTFSSWSPDGKQIIITNSQAEVWDTETMTVTLTFSDHIPFSASWSPDGNRILSTDAWSQYGSAKVWDPKTGDVLLDLFPQNFVYGVSTGAWSLDGMRIVTFSEDELGRIWDAQTGRELLRFGGVSGGQWASWSPTAERILIDGLSGQVKVYDAVTGDELLSYEIGSQSGASFSPDGEQIAVADWDGNIFIFPTWDSLDALMEDAYDCCIFRQLTPEERQQFGLP